MGRRLNLWGPPKDEEMPEEIKKMIDDLSELGRWDAQRKTKAFEESLREILDKAGIR